MFEGVAPKRLSQTYIYGLGPDGYCLARAQLTEDAVYEMMGNAKRHKKNRKPMLEEASRRAQGGFELLMQIESDGPMRSVTPKVIEAWTRYFSFTSQFSQVKPSLINEGLHLILVGWFSPEKVFRIRPIISMLPTLLTDEQLVVMSQVASKPPHR